MATEAEERRVGETSHAARAFSTTHWSVVMEAGQDASPGAQTALEELCRRYWFPLYAYVRRQGHGPHDAQDLVQDFFARFLRQQSVRLANRARGRFRTFLLTSLKHFLINEWRKTNRSKRGGGRQVISLDAQDTEARLQAEPADHRTPEKTFERRWAMVVLGRVLDQLQTEWMANDRGHLFEELKPFLTGEGCESSCAEIAPRLGKTEGNVKVMVHRLRHRYRDVLRQEIAATVDRPEAIEDEIRCLIAALGD